MINSQKDADFTSHQFGSMTSDIKQTAPTSVNPKQLSELH
jgi:hypothetical protein